MLPADLVIENASELLTIRGASSRPKTGKSMSSLGIIRDGAVAVSRGKISWVGASDRLRGSVRVGPRTKVIDASGRVVMPGLIDCHTHLVFAGSREREWLDRLSGRRSRGATGILSTVSATRRASDSELTKLALANLGSMLSSGTTTAEAKSGYGLSIRDELRILAILGRLGAMQPVEIVPTFLGAHAVPGEFDGSASYTRFVIDDMLPRVVRQGIAKYCDVFCERGAFTADESLDILRACKAEGLKPRIHTDEFSDIGGTDVANKVHAASADHLDAITPNGVRNIKAAGSIAVLMPGVPFFLGSDAYADARGLIDAGIPVALATDFNPGTCPCLSLQFIVSLACIKLGMSPAEALSAVTINAAHAIGMADTIGSIEAGKQADIVIMDVGDHRLVPYGIARNSVHTVIKRGGIVVQG